MNDKFYKVSYNKFHNDVNLLADKLQKCYDTKNITLVAPQRSGLLISGILSYILPFKDIFVVKADRYKHTFDYIYYTPEFLFVDTIIETKGTLNKIVKNYLGKDITKIHVACLYDKWHDASIISVERVDRNKWIKFPWEGNEK